MTPKAGALLAAHRDRLRRMVALRLARRLQGRIDASDMIQEAYLEARTGWTTFFGAGELVSHSLANTKRRAYTTDTETCRGPGLP